MQTACAKPLATGQDELPSEAEGRDDMQTLSAGRFAKLSKPSAVNRSRNSSAAAMTSFEIDIGCRVEIKHEPAGDIDPIFPAE